MVNERVKRILRAFEDMKRDSLKGLSELLCERVDKELSRKESEKPKQFKLDKANYEFYTIKKINNLSVKHGKYIDANIGLIDDATQKVLINVSLRVPLPEIMDFLNLQNQQHLENVICSKLIGNKIFGSKEYPDILFNKTKINERYRTLEIGHLRGIYIPEEGNVVIDNIYHNNYLPTKGYFESFKEEKEFRKDYPPSCDASRNWGFVYKPKSRIDSDILELVKKLNQIDFIYTKEESCSGTPKDHEGEYVDRIKPYFESIGEGEMGFINLRADTSDPRYISFKKGLENLCDVELVEIDYNDPDNNFQRQKGIKNKAIKAAVPSCIVLNKNHPDYQNYLSDKWKKVYQFIEILVHLQYFYNPLLK